MSVTDDSSAFFTSLCARRNWCLRLKITRLFTSVARIAPIIMAATNKIDNSHNALGNRIWVGVRGGGCIHREIIIIHKRQGTGKTKRESERDVNHLKEK